MLHAHSGLRYIALLLIVIAIVNAVKGLKKDTYVKKDKMINLFAMIVLHVQLLLGLGLYFTSDKVQFTDVMSNSQTRFFTVDHILMMVIAIALVTIGRKKAEKEVNAVRKHKKIVTFYTIGLVVIFFAIPWPFLRNLGSAWF